MLDEGSFKHIMDQIEKFSALKEVETEIRTLRHRIAAELKSAWSCMSSLQREEAARFVKKLERDSYNSDLRELFH